MPPKENKDTSTQSFSFDTVAVLVATIMANGGNLGAKEYKRMSALDGTRGEHGFNHMFREVKRRAKELNDQAQANGELTPATKPKAAPGSAKKKAEATATKRVRKPTNSEDAAADDEEEEEATPNKKMKPEPKDEDQDDAPSEPSYDLEYL